MELGLCSHKEALACTKMKTPLRRELPPIALDRSQMVARPELDPLTMYRRVCRAEHPMKSKTGQTKDRAIGRGSMKMEIYGLTVEMERESILGLILAPEQELTDDEHLYILAPH